MTSLGLRAKEMNGYLHPRKSTEVLATESKTNDHFPCPVSSMDCSQVAAADIWFSVLLIRKKEPQFFPRLLVPVGFLFDSFIDFLNVIK